jgi:membrane protein
MTHHTTLAQIVWFLKTDIWRIREKDLPRTSSLLIRPLRVLVLTLRGLVQDRANLRASALTFYSILSIVPVAAMAFGISKGFGFERSLERLVLENLEGQEEVAQRIVQFAHALLENVKGGLVAGIGIILLFYTIIKILSHIENAFNHIWGIEKPRNWTRRISDYLSLMLICPVLFILSSAGTVMIMSGARLAIQKVSVLGAVGPAIFFALNLLPYGVIWVLFAFLYIFIPNTRVHFISGALAGVIAGTLFQIFQRSYIFLQVGVSKYNAIYGSFAALPLFFIWLQISWLIVLFGAEVAFAHQNVHTYEFEPDCHTASHAFKRLMCLVITHLLVKCFLGGEKPLQAEHIAQRLESPVRLVNQLLFELVASGIVSEIRSNSENRAVAYQPARDPEALTIKYILNALDQRGSHDIPVARSEAFEKISASLKQFNDLLEKSESNRLLKEI